MTTRETFIALLSDSVQMIVSDRAPNGEERQGMAKVRFEVGDATVAEDALGLLVNRANGLSSLSLEGAADLLSGRTRDWVQVPGSGLTGPVRVVTTGRDSGAWELLAGRFFPGAGVPVPTEQVSSQREVLARVASDPRALGVASVAVSKDFERGDAVKALAIAGTDSLGNPVMHRLHQANIHLGVYPLHYRVRVYFDKSSLLALGFSAFMAGAPGQKLVLDAGLVPATMPVRLVQLR
jgi:phosphate transport system substrate-binding protein